MSHRILIEKSALSFLHSLPEKTQRIISEKLQSLRNNPYPGIDGDKELLHLSGDYQLYLLHISRQYTVFYRIDSNQMIVKILDIMTIEKAHKKYGRL
ncbi:type II toxin-antitoxin system RelE/ParE family toxin [Methanospirillum sp. J.3.6.1-F.2.7.3]|uniref:Type II toxin-antitoxin system RelE/ParE family toxin n=1 Tax=Methanospirillum purgamenti TaxID=2834276 RepID=A0A8E7B0F1_9EURY|nr:MULTISPECIES: type II toxin-antitoxin system RelE/ParE family toxin [Methanospirillum]MDX8551205.1 type II toxin-antitoxin system RelE/ParE family toxin [Methanospirillum hungatei]QVV88173.1 type II toxin-antitoxin system RelE/ParE family toxin [Methanospirillum sp. J.3.6.1-F.2.7.3]